jgi:N-acetylglucosaminyldiphosphoundecaprenol N-acetyl-beta-D-mannosaminyltransferase
MSRDDILECINLSEPDMVVVSLGAAKGQDWICRNYNSINAPVIGHLGAVINFVAGSVQRAPSWMQRSGLEWVWRVKEESTLVKRYANDGLSFLRMLATRVLPLAWYQATRKPSADALRSASVDFQVQSTTSVMRLSGAWNTTNLTPVREAFTRAQEAGTSVDMHMAEVSSIDSAFVGLLLLLEQSLATRNLSLRLVGTPISIRRYLALSCVSHLVME